MTHLSSPLGRRPLSKSVAGRADDEEVGNKGRNRGPIALALCGVLLLAACDVPAEVADAATDPPAAAAPSEGTTPAAPKERSKEKVRSPKEPQKEPGETSPGVAALVTRVIDGDTIEVSRKGRIFSLRLIGIDTPETVHPSEPVQCFGREASAFADRNLSGRRIGLEYDVERRDRYGRDLGYVWLDGRLFNRTIVAKGYAQVSTYPPNVKYTDRFLAAQRKARFENRGLWSGCPAEEGTAAPVKSGSGGKCDSNYSGACVPPYPPDIDCSDMKAKNFRSTGSDPHGFDGDGDGRACEA